MFSGEVAEMQHMYKKKKQKILVFTRDNMEKVLFEIDLSVWQRVEYEKRFSLMVFVPFSKPFLLMDLLSRFQSN